MQEARFIHWQGGCNIGDLIIKIITASTAWQHVKLN